MQEITREYADWRRAGMLLGREGENIKQNLR
jgi:hypothetical protein